jgi:hypothetical protein
MPTIIVMTTSTTEHDSAETLREDVQPEHLEDKHHADQLVERIGWAVTDAEADEGTRTSAIASEDPRGSGARDPSNT